MDQLVLPKDHLKLFLRELNTGDISAAQQTISEAVQLFPLILKDPETFINVVIEFAQSPVISDPITFAQYAVDNLPGCAQSLKRTRSHILGQLFIAKAFHSYASGYMSQVRGNLIAGLRYDLSHLKNRGVTSIYIKSFLKQNSGKNKLLKEEVVKIFKHFEDNNLKAWLIGSLVISLYANRFVKNHSDIDLITLAIDDHNKAVELLIRDLNYKYVDREEWKTKGGETEFHTILISENNCTVEVGFISEEDNSVYTPENFLEIENVKVYTLNLKDLKHSYADNLWEISDEKRSSYLDAIKFIDQLLTRESALMILVPEVENLVKSFRDKYDPSAVEGMPAHITILYPFKPPHEINSTTMERLINLLSRFPRFTLSFSDLGRFQNVIYLDPVPDDPLKALTEAIAELFPEAPPYGGAYNDIIPHLTVAQMDDTKLLDTIADKFSRTARGNLPIQADVSSVVLMDDVQGKWQVRRRFYLD